MDRSRHFKDLTNSVTNIEGKVYTIDDDKWSGEIVEQASIIEKGGGLLKVWHVWNKTVPINNRIRWLHTNRENSGNASQSELVLFFGVTPDLVQQQNPPSPSERGGDI